LSVINYFFLYVFKCFIFLTTTYYIVQDFNTENTLEFIGRLFGGKDKPNSDNLDASQKDSFAREFAVELTSIMLASIYISFAHFVLSWVMLDIFEVSEFNFVVSLVLGKVSLT